MSAKNNCNFIGNIGRDCDVRETKSGTSVATFPMAVETGWGDNKVTSWIRCNLFGKRAEGGLIQYLVKGQQIAVSGSLKVNQYTDKEGIEKTSADLMLDDIALVGNKREQAQEHRSPAPKEFAEHPLKNDPFADTGDDDDVGF